MDRFLALAVAHPLLGSIVSRFAIFASRIATALSSVASAYLRTKLLRRFRVRLRIGGFLLLFLLGIYLSVGRSWQHRQLAAALRLEREGRSAAALDLFQASLAHFAPDDKAHQSAIWLHIGECLSALDRRAEAFIAYSRAVEFDDNNVLAHLRLGELYLQSGAADHASEQATSVIHSATLNADGFELLGAAAAANGDSTNAKYAYTRALELEPGRMKVAISRAQLFSHEG